VRGSQTVAICIGARAPSQRNEEQLGAKGGSARGCSRAERGRRCRDASTPSERETLQARSLLNSIEIDFETTPTTSVSNKRRDTGSIYGIVRSSVPKFGPRTAQYPRIFVPRPSHLVENLVSNSRSRPSPRNFQKVPVWYRPPFF
jgi:hypothetical protein